MEELARAHEAAEAAFRKIYMALMHANPPDVGQAAELARQSTNFHFEEATKTRQKQADLQTYVNATEHSSESG